MGLKNRGIIGSWRDGTKRTLIGVVNLIFISGITTTWLYTLHQHSVGVVSFDGYAAVSLFFIGALIAFIADDTNIRYVLAWIVDDEEIGYL